MFHLINIIRMPQIDAASSSGNLRGYGDRKIAAIGPVVSEIEAGECRVWSKWAAGPEKRRARWDFGSHCQGDGGERAWTKFETCGGGS
jgi:hypothetical protein